MVADHQGRGHQSGMRTCLASFWRKVGFDLNEPGQAAVFAKGDIHSIEFGDDTFFIRVTGGDVESKKTLKFDVDKKTVEVADRAMNQR